MVSSFHHQSPKKSWAKTSRKTRPRPSWKNRLCWNEDWRQSWQSCLELGFGWRLAPVFTTDSLEKRIWERAIFKWQLLEDDFWILLISPVKAIVLRHAFSLLNQASLEEETHLRSKAEVARKSPSWLTPPRLHSIQLAPTVVAGSISRGRRAGIPWFSHPIILVAFSYTTAMKSCGCSCIKQTKDP